MNGTSTALALAVCLAGGLGAEEPAADDLATAVRGNADFAGRLYRHLAREDGNLVGSPYSISTALAMTWAGAAGRTAQQMAATLGFTLPAERQHQAMGALSQGLQSGGDDAFTLRVANALWGQKGEPFRPDYLALVERYYGGGLNQVDFIGDRDGARTTINTWVSERTEARIPELLGPGVLTPDTRLVLTNAVYFLGKWAVPFDPSNTRDDEFHLAGGGTKTVPFMADRATYGYFEMPGFKAVEMAYRGGRMSMVLCLPDEGMIETIEQNLDAEHVVDIGQSLQPTELILVVPKWKYSSEFSLAEVLQAMGMTDAFRYGDADFSPINGRRDFFIGDVIHKAFVAVDEEGTEAAAATAVVMRAGSAPQQQPPVIKFDRPFLFLIRDTVTGSVIFWGRVSDPSAE